MKLEGSLSTNLEAAVASARRLKGHPVHSDTLGFWHDLLVHARAEIRHGGDGDPALERLIADLEGELAERTR